MGDLTSLDLLTIHCVLATRGPKDEQVQGDGVGARGNSKKGEAWNHLQCRPRRREKWLWGSPTVSQFIPCSPIQRLFSKFFSRPVNGEGCSPYFSEARQCGRSKNLGTFQLMPDNQAWMWGAPCYFQTKPSIFCTSSHRFMKLAEMLRDRVWTARPLLLVSVEMAGNM